MECNLVGDLKDRRFRHEMDSMKGIRKGQV